MSTSIAKHVIHGSPAMDSDQCFELAYDKEETDDEDSIVARMRHLTREETNMTELLEQVKDQIQEAWDLGHKVTITVESKLRSSKR